MKPYVQFLLTLVVMLPVVTLADLAGVPFIVTLVVFFLASNQQKTEGWCNSIQEEEET